MTREEAISVLEESKRQATVIRDNPSVFYNSKSMDGGVAHMSRCVKAYDMALSALRAQQEQRKNEPLTLEELREMRGEPVFIQNLRRKPEGEWKIIRHVSETAVSFTDKTSRYIPDSSPAAPCYGRTWLAYRRQPAGGDDDENL